MLAKKYLDVFVQFTAPGSTRAFAGTQALRQT